MYLRVDPSTHAYSKFLWIEMARGYAQVEALAHSARFEEKGDARAGTLALSAWLGERKGGRLCPGRRALAHSAQVRGKAMLQHAKELVHSAWLG